MSRLSPRDLSLPRFALRRDEAAASVSVSPTKFDEWVTMAGCPGATRLTESFSGIATRSVRRGSAFAMGNMRLTPSTESLHDQGSIGVLR